MFDFILGEIRKMKFTVRNSMDNDIMVIQSAVWQLEDMNGVLEQSGECTIDGTDIYAIVAMTVKGRHRLTITVDVPPETIKTDVNITVRG